ncbi:hypothetical protein [Caproicibacter sp.]|uniref:hypothetical protein n=1 Tax=Caproicibacter sp. TaxID=2814884 RepID=UPI0039893E94
MENQNPMPQPAQYQPQPPQAYQNPASYEDASPLSVGNYIIMMLISVIPIVNLMMLFVWGFGNSNRNKKNWARAQLIMLAVGILLCVLFGASLVASIASMGVARY